MALGQTFSAREPNRLKYNGKLKRSVNPDASGEEQQFLLNGRELGWYDYGFRMYDPQLARFHTLDPLAEYFPNQSPYVYADNNPIRYIDYLGLSAEEPEEPIDGGEIEEVVCVGNRSKKNNKNNKNNKERETGYQIEGSDTKGTEWNDNLPTARNPLWIGGIEGISAIGGFTKSYLPSKYLKWLKDGFLGVHSLIKRLGIVGDTEDKAIEKTIPEGVREKLEENDETALETDSIIVQLGLYFDDGTDSVLVYDKKRHVRYNDGRIVSKPYWKKWNNPFK
jgi:RHS repeat-associated protein